MAGAAAHCADEQPVATCAGILIHGACKVRAFVLGGIEAESRGVAGKGKVVVDSLWHVDVVDGIVLGLEELGYAVRGGSGIVSADGDQKLNVVVFEEFKIEVLLEILVRGLETAHLEVGTAAVEICVSLEEIDVFGAGSLAEKPGITAVKADNAITIGKECFCYRANDGVHARSRAAATEDDY